MLDLESEVSSLTSSDGNSEVQYGSGNGYSRLICVSPVMDSYLS